jgi:hypothetical protein
MARPNRVASRFPSSGGICSGPLMGRQSQKRPTNAGADLPTGFLARLAVVRTPHSDFSFQLFKDWEW